MAKNGVIRMEEEVKKDAEKKYKKKIAKLESDNESLRRHVEQARDANRKRWVSTKKRKHLKDDWLRLIIPDVHGSAQDKVAISVLLSDMKRFDIDEIIIIGDFVECGGFLAQHQTMGYVAETEYTFENDVAASNKLLDKILTIAPAVKKIHYLEGNHEHRIEKWCVTSAVKNKHDSQFLLDQLGPQKVLNLKERGIDYYVQNEFYNDLPVPGTIKLGECHFTHGISTAKHAAYQHAIKLGGNIVYGHTHRGDSVETKTVVAGQIGAWCPGCLCKKQRMWNHTKPTEWTHGFGLQVVARSGLFQNINARIIGKQSMLFSLGKHFK